MTRYGMLFAAVLLAAGAAWRALVALQHYQSSLEVADDPSIRELEQVSAGIEGGFSLILLLHGVALIALSRRPLQIRWPYAIGIALLCAAVLGGSLLGVPMFSLPGVYPASIVAGVLVLSHFLTPAWVSLYLGAVFGSVVAWYFAAPAADWFVGLFIVGPCVALAFLGAGLRMLLVRILAARSSS